MISIIVPTLNEEDYILHLLKCLEAQNFACEVIIVDGNSTDKTTAVIKEFAHTSTIPVRVVHADKPGVAFQRNLGKTFAKFDQLLFLDADVLVPNDFLKNALNEISRRKITIAGTRLYSAEKSIHFRIGYWLYSHIFLYILRIFNPVLHGCSIFIQRDLHDQIGGFTENITFEDFEYAKKAAALHKTHLLRSTYIRTSARRFYNPSLRSLLELIGGALFSFKKAGISNQKWMKAYHQNVGQHPKPKY